MQYSKIANLAHFLTPLAILLCVSLIAPFIVQAQGIEIIDETGTTNEPYLFLDQIVVHGGGSVTNSVISGSFKLFNVGLQTADKVSYQTSIVTTQDVGGFYVPLEKVTSGEMSEQFILPSGEKDLSFVIDTPDVLPDTDSFGVYIEVYINGQYTTFELAPIRISGEKRSYLSVDARLQLEEEEFFLLEGPTVNPGEPLVLTGVITSQMTYEDVQPIITINKGPRYDVGNIVQELTPPVRTISQDGEMTFSYDLPTDLEPGVYTVGLSYYDTDGEGVSVVTEARYVIAGLKPMITTVSFNNTDQTAINDFIVSVQYSDAPLSARLDENGDFLDSRAEVVFSKAGEEVFDALGYEIPDNMSVHVRLYGPLGELLAEEVTQNTSRNPVDVSFDPLEIKQVQVHVELLQDGEIVDEYQTIVDVQPTTVISIADIMREKPLYLLIGIVALVLLIVVLSLITRYFKRDDAIIESI